LRLRFAPDDQILGDVARAVDPERQCCRFLSFTITVDPDSGPITLDLDWPPGLTALFLIEFKRRTSIDCPSLGLVQRK